MCLRVSLARPCAACVSSGGIPSAVAVSVHGAAERGRRCCWGAAAEGVWPCCWALNKPQSLFL